MEKVSASWGGGLDQAKGAGIAKRWLSRGNRVSAVDELRECLSVGWLGRGLALVELSWVELSWVELSITPAYAQCTASARLVTKYNEVR